jgi:PilZ domain
MATKKKAAARTKAKPAAKEGKPEGARGATGAENRKHPRVPLEVLVQVRSESINSFRAVHAKNLSIGGMFIETEEKRPDGSQVYFQFTVKDGGTLIEGLGRIVHVGERGMGIEFVSVLEPSASIIRALVDERLRVA